MSQRTEVPHFHHPWQNLGERLGRLTHDARVWTSRHWKRLSLSVAALGAIGYIIHEVGPQQPPVKPTTPASDTLNFPGSGSAILIPGIASPTPELPPLPKPSPTLAAATPEASPTKAATTEATATATNSPTVKPAEAQPTPTAVATVPAKPTLAPTPKPTAERIVRNANLGTSTLEPGPSPVWSDKTWEQILQEVDDKVLPTSPVGPIDSEGNPVKMEIQSLRSGLDPRDPNKITNIFYTYPYLSQGTEIRAISSGIVELLADMPDTKTSQIVGHQLTIRHPSGGIAMYPYIHGKEPLAIKKGDFVQQGQLIARIGDQKLPHIMPWDMSVTFSPTGKKEDQDAYVANYQKYWYSWPPVSALSPTTK